MANKNIIGILDAIRELSSEDITGMVYNVDEDKIYWNGITEIDRTTIDAKVSEMQSEEDTKFDTQQNNKVSAYRKMEMTDDEILAIDPTLEEYL
jgi:hypothetical protein|tara:strand:+ start:228 stop:509 length:282 start_codon:yes stop_codon:yes gene_type:complete